MPVGFFGPSDLDVLLADFGVPVVVGAVTAKGIVDAPDEEMLAGEFAGLVGRVTVVLVKTDAFSAVLSRGATITVDGAALKVHSYIRIDDGAYTRVVCVKVT